MNSPAAPEPRLGGFRHEVAWYFGQADLPRTIVPFIREGVRRGEPVLVALVPERLALVEEALGEDATRVDFVDMSELGGNPACIIPEWRRFLDDMDGAGSVRGVGEPIWYGRRDVELVEAELHEALLNVAFDGGPPWRLLCPYDVSRLPAEVLEDARRNHPWVYGDQLTTPRAPRVADGSVGFGGHDHAVRSFQEPLPAPPERATVVRFGPGDLALLREEVRDVADRVGVPRPERDNVVLAMHELAANSVLHGGGGGLLALWLEPGALVVEVHDTGRIDDALVGRGSLDLDAESGRGIWMANQLCDLVQVRSGREGTQVRLWTWLS